MVVHTGQVMAARKVLETVVHMELVMAVHTGQVMAAHMAQAMCIYKMVY